MSEKEVKATRHNVIILLLSDNPITYSQATFKLAKTIDTDLLADNGLLILGYDFANGLEIDDQKNRKRSQTGSRIAAVLEGSPGALGKLYAKAKGIGWKQLYLGFAAGVILLILLSKWIGRILTGTFF